MSVTIHPALRETLTQGLVDRVDTSHVTRDGDRILVHYDRVERGADGRTYFYCGDVEIAWGIYPECDVFLPAGALAMELS